MDHQVSLRHTFIFTRHMVDYMSLADYTHTFIAIYLLYLHLSHYSHTIHFTHTTIAITILSLLLHTHTIYTISLLLLHTYTYYLHIPLLSCTALDQAVLVVGVDSVVDPVLPLLWTAWGSPVWRNRDRGSCGTREQWGSPHPKSTTVDPSSACPPTWRAHTTPYTRSGLTTTPLRMLCTRMAGEETS